MGVYKWYAYAGPVTIQFNESCDIVNKKIIRKQKTNKNIPAKFKTTKGYKRYDEYIESINDEDWNNNYKVFDTEREAKLYLESIEFKPKEKVSDEDLEWLRENVRRGIKGLPPLPYNGIK